MSTVLLTPGTVVAWDMVRIRLRVLGVLILAGAAVGAGHQAPPLEKARKLARSHRYAEVLQLLEPFAGRKDLPSGQRFEVLAEVGRARFNLGRYPGAYRAFSQALKIQPQSAEVGVYLEASAWLTGRRGEARAIFDALLKSGARDLYLAVTLPGEQSFLANPEVWAILSRYQRDLVVDLRHGVALGAKLGSSRDAVMAVLPGSPPAEGRELVLRAGPRVLWALRFNEEGEFEEVLLDAENLLRYTPYRLRFACGLDWRMTPGAVAKVLGPPEKDRPGDDGGRVLTWRFGTVDASLEFGPPRKPRPPVFPPNSDVLRILRLVRVTSAS